MVYKGHFRNGVVVLDEPAQIGEGVAVEITVSPEEMSPAAEPENQIPTLYDRLESIIGVIDDLPPDFARNHDHYIHGTPKR